jgi:hypothetical protein
MSPTKLVFCAVLVTAAVVSAVAYAFRPPSPFDALETLPRALAECAQRGEFDVVRRCLADDFSLRGAPGLDDLGANGAVAVLAELVQRGLIPCVAHCVVEPGAEDAAGEVSATIYGVVLEGDRARHVKVEAKAERRDGDWVFLSAKVTRGG